MMRALLRKISPLAWASGFHAVARHFAMLLIAGLDASMVSADKPLF